VKTLERLGYQTDVAGNGVEVLDALDRAPYDVVLMDVQMPEMDGLTATRRLREILPSDRQPQVVAMTAGAFAEDREACLAAGMDGFLCKPVDRGELASTLERSAAAVAERSSAASGGVPDRDVPDRDVDRAPDGRTAGTVTDTASDLSGVATVTAEQAPSVAVERAGRAVVAALDALAADFDVETVSELVESYLDESPPLVAAIAETAGGARAAGERAAAAHSLKSSSASLGAEELARACQALEDHHRDRDGNDARSGGGTEDDVVTVRLAADVVAQATVARAVMKDYVRAAAV
nr:response regulator [Micromonospora sp. DSM 115978]